MARVLTVVVVMTGLVMLVVVSANANTISIVSGDGPVGGLDEDVWVYGAAVTVGAPSYPAAAVSLRQAMVINKNGAWCAPPSGAGWIGVADGSQNSPPYGYKYYVDFLMPQAFLNPHISVTGAADDAADVYLNGHMVGTGFTLAILKTFSYSEASWYLQGVNRLEFYLQNNTFVSFNPSGLTFSAQVIYDAVPEPSALFTLLSGVGGLGRVMWRRRGRKV